MLIAFVSLWLALVLLPDIPMRRGLRRWMVERPADRLSRVTRGQWLMLGLVLASVALCIWIIGREAPLLIGMGLPDVAMIASSVELSSLLDVAVTAMLLSAGVRWRSMVQAMRATIWRARAGSARRQRARRTRRPQRSATNDDDPAPVWIMVAA